MVQAGLVGSEEQVTLRYEQDPWEWLQPIVAEMPVDTVMQLCGYSKSMAFKIKNGTRRPSKAELSMLWDRLNANPFCRRGRR